jgi:hypothetical protein
MDSSADKEGLQSSGRKEQSSRHGAEPSPAMGPVTGAFGREGLDRETGGKPQVPAQEDADVLDDDELDFDEDDLDLDMDEDDDEDVTDAEAERADGA